jgi:hypothetical protein
VPEAPSVVREAVAAAEPLPPPATPLRSLAVAAGAAVLGFLLGRTKLSRVVKAAPEALPTAMKAAAAVTAVDRYLAERAERERRRNEAA